MIGVLELVEVGTGGFKYRRERALREPSIVDLARVRRRTRGPYAQTLLRYS